MIAVRQGKLAGISKMITEQQAEEVPKGKQKDHGRVDGRITEASVSSCKPGLGTGLWGRVRSQQLGLSKERR